MECLKEMTNFYNATGNLGKQEITSLSKGGYCACYIGLFALEKVITIFLPGNITTSKHSGPPLIRSPPPKVIPLIRLDFRWTEIVKYSQTCIKRSPFGQKNSGLIRQVTS